MTLQYAIVFVLFGLVSRGHATTHQIDLKGTAGLGLLPGNETPAVTGGTGGEIGSGITYDDVTNLLTLNVGWGSSQGFIDLTSASNNSHIHGPTAANFGNNAGNFRQTAGAPFTLTRSSNLATGGVITTAPITLTETQETDLLNGKYYINIHTANNGGGEIRGFLVAVPTVTGISPSSGSTAGGTSVTIGGTNFTGATSVTIGGVAAAIGSVTSTSITATTGAQAEGVVDVVVVTPAGTATGAGLFTFLGPNYLITTVIDPLTGVMTITDVSNNADVLGISQPAAGNILFSAVGRSFSLNGSALTTGNSGNISLAGITSIIVNAAGGSNTINVGGFTGTVPSLTINGGTGDDSVNFTGDINFANNRNLEVDLQNDAVSPGADLVTVTSGTNVIATGDGLITVRASKSVSITGGSSLEAQFGGITVEANQQTTATPGNFIGVNVDGAGSMIRSTNSAGTSVIVGGKGGNHSSGSQHGVSVTSGGKITGGMTAETNVTGVGGASTGADNHGVTVSGAGSQITSNGAAVTVIGTGGVNSAAGGHGVAISLGGSITSSFLPLQITGTGAGAVGSSSNMGILMGACAISSASGIIGMTGTPGPGTPSGGSGSWGVFFGASATLSSPFTTLTLTTASLSIDPTASISVTGPGNKVVFIANAVMDLGGSDASGRLGLTDAELDRVTTSVMRFEGSSYTLSAPISRSGGIDTAFTFVAGTSLTAPGSGTDLSIGFGNLLLQQPLLMPITGAAPDTGFPQLSVGGLIDLNSVPLSIIGTTHPGARGDTFIIVANDSSDSITGTFSGLPEGAKIPWPANPNLAAQITYSGGTNNDVMLTLVDPFEVTVINTADSGAGSLRQAIINAAAAPGVNTVTFDSSLSGAQIGLLSEITLNDPAGVIIDGSALSAACRIVAALDNIRLFRQLAGSAATVRGVWLQNGASLGDGGAIVNEGNLTLESCSISDHEAVNGGAIQNLSQLTVHQCTFAHNTSTGSGAAVNNVTPGTATFTHCTVSANTSGTLGAITNTNTAAITLVNCIIHGNTGLLDVSGEVTRRGNNICGNFPGIPAGTGSAYITTDPRVAAFDVYGNRLPSMPLLLRSPAIDQAGLAVPSPLVDQLAKARPKGIRADLGAVEGPVIIVNIPQDDLTFTAAGVTLRDAIFAAQAGDTIYFDRSVFTGGNTITLLYGPLNPQVNCTLDASDIPGGLSIVHDLVIHQHPQSLALATNAEASFTVLHENFNGGVTYDWRRNGTSLLVSTPVLTLPGVTEANEGLYDVVITQAASPGTLVTTNNIHLEPLQVISQPASLIVDGSPAAILRQPVGSFVALGSPVSLSLIATGPALTYQWFKNGVKVAGATKSSLLVPKAAFSHAGAYTCVVKSGPTSLTSVPVQVDVADTRSRTLNLRVGSKFTVTASAAGRSLSYLWSSGQTTPSITIPAVAIGDAGLYTCTVSGFAGGISGVASTRLNVSAAIPQLDVIALPAATIGQNYTYQIPVQNIPGAPATSFSITGALPKGMTFNKTTGILSGRPTTSKPAGFPLTFSAINISGPSLPATAPLSVNIVPSSAVGTFAGPIERSPFNNDLGGRIDLTTTATGTFSGSITLGAVRRSFKSQLLLSDGPSDVILRGVIPAFKDARNRNASAFVEVFAPEQLARITFLDEASSAFVSTAWRKVPTATAGLYTLRLDPGTVTDAPHGYGYSTLKVSPTNAVTITGKLPDNTTLTGSSFLGPNGEILIYHLLYANKGSLVGQHQLTGADLTGIQTWSKPLTAGTLYKDPFGPLTITSAGGVYFPPAEGQRVMGLPTVPSPNAELSFTLGGLAPEFSQLLDIVNPSVTGLTNTAVIAVPINVTGLRKLTATTGLFAGSFQINGATTALHRLAPFFGQIVKIGATTQGYGYFLLPKIPVGSERVTTAPKLSGRVVLGVP